MIGSNRRSEVQVPNGRMMHTISLVLTNQLSRILRLDICFLYFFLFHLCSIRFSCFSQNRVFPFHYPVVGVSRNDRRDQDIKSEELRGKFERGS